MSKSLLELRISSILAQRQQASKLRVLKSSPPGSVDFSSNDFLSLATNPEFRRDYLHTLNNGEYGVGSTGSRLLDGNSTFAESLEQSIATFHGAETGLLTNSGFDANVSIFACLPQPGDVIVYDELIHASVHDGVRQSRAKTRISFKHNDVHDLSRVLKSLIQTQSQRSIFVAVESVYSMDGDLAPLNEIVELLETYTPGLDAHLVVDEAHATGCYGPNGAGRVSQLGLERRVSIRLHTFGKALACNGAIILCSPAVRSYLINYARPLIYTTFMSYPNLVAIKVAYQWLQDGKADQLAQNLNNLTNHLHTCLLSLAPEVSGLTEQLLLTLPPACPGSPIFALLSLQPRDLAMHCQKAGFIVRAVVSPTVPEGTERVRVCLHAGNTVEQINAFVGCVREWILLQPQTHQQHGVIRRRHDVDSEDVDYPSALAGNSKAYMIDQKKVDQTWMLAKL